MRSLRFSIFSGFELSGARARGRVSEERRTEKHAQATTREVRERKAPLPVVGAFIWGFHTRAGRCTGWVLRVCGEQQEPRAVATFSTSRVTSWGRGVEQPKSHNLIESMSCDERFPSQNFIPLPTTFPAAYVWQNTGDLQRKAKVSAA